MKCRNCGTAVLLDPIPPPEAQDEGARPTICCGCTARFTNEPWPEFWTD